ncbi:MAG: hypothetical protein ACKPKO_12800, partial [Candidatus Fonsibacter sp.]
MQPEETAKLPDRAEVDAKKQHTLGQKGPAMLQDNHISGTNAQLHVPPTGIPRVARPRISSSNSRISLFISAASRTQTATGCVTRRIVPLRLGPVPT